ncbi:MAG: hypothetical protein JNN32_02290 [Flavobacteriales bacterium]|nr:hypothetical protein [Flavobacteriales bacterium]
MNYLAKYQGATKSWVHEPVSNERLVEDLPELLSKVNRDLDFVCMFNGGDWSELNLVLQNPEFQKELHEISKNKVLFVHLVMKGRNDTGERFGDLAQIEFGDDSRAEFWRAFLAKNFKDRAGSYIEEMSDLLSRPSIAIFRLFRNLDSNEAQSIEDAFVQPLMPVSRAAYERDPLKVDDIYESTLEYFKLINDQIISDQQHWQDMKKREDMRTWLEPLIKNTPKGVSLSKIIVMSASQFFG